ncbi:MAG: hypothetical protein AAFY42_01350 [Pseudomonadota bacterium]
MNTKVENEGLASSAKAPEKKLAFGLFGCKMGNAKEAAETPKLGSPETAKAA